eukprot:s1336_g2.t9
MLEYRSSRFGFEVNNTIGETPQRNPWSDDWVAFYRDHRLGYQVDMADDGYLTRLFNAVSPRLPELFDGVDVRPSILHGDFWTGNIGVVKGKPAIFDPAAYYGHHEAEWGMSWCASLSDEFWEGYRERIPEQPGFEARRPLYQAYHQINHYNLFGGADVPAHLAFLEVRCPQLAQKAVKDPERAFWTIFLVADAVSTLRHLLLYRLYLYTDALPEFFGVNITPALDLLIFAGSLVSSPAQVFSGTSRMKKSRLADGSCVVRRLYALCEQHILSSITRATMVEVLQTARKIGLKKLEDGVDRFLAGEGRDLIKRMTFNQSLVALNSEHPTAVARAVCRLPSCWNISKYFESTRAADGTPLDLVSRVDCRICWEEQSEQATFQLAAHRFILAARSAYFAAMLSTPMRESSSGHIPISLPLVSSSAAAKAFLRYLYTNTFLDEVDGQPLTTCDLVDLLAIVDGPGGHNFLQLSERACSEVQQQVLASLEGTGKTASMIFLQRSMAQQCKTALPFAFDEALENCAVVCPDLESFKACFPTAKEEWWTPEMEQEMHLQLLWRRSSVMQSERKECSAARRREERALHFRIFRRKLDQSEVSHLVSLDWCAAWRGFLVGFTSRRISQYGHSLSGDRQADSGGLAASRFRVQGLGFRGAKIGRSIAMAATDLRCMLARCLDEVLAAPCNEERVHALQTLEVPMPELLRCAPQRLLETPEVRAASAKLRKSWLSCFHRDLVQLRRYAVEVLCSLGFGRDLAQELEAALYVQLPAERVAEFCCERMEESLHVRRCRAFATVRSAKPRRNGTPAKQASELRSLIPPPDAWQVQKQVHKEAPPASAAVNAEEPVQEASGAVPENLEALFGDGAQLDSDVEDQIEEFEEEDRIEDFDDSRTPNRSSRAAVEEQAVPEGLSAEEVIQDPLGSDMPMMTNTSGELAEGWHFCAGAEFWLRGAGPAVMQDADAAEAPESGRPDFVTPCDAPREADPKKPVEEVAPEPSGTEAATRRRADSGEVLAEIARILQVPEAQPEWGVEALGLPKVPEGAEAALRAAAKAFRCMARKIHPDGRQGLSEEDEQRSHEALAKLQRARRSVHRLAGCVPFKPPRRPEKLECYAVGPAHWRFTWKIAPMESGRPVSHYEVRVEDGGFFVTVAEVDPAAATGVLELKEDQLSSRIRSCLQTKGSLRAKLAAVGRGGWKVMGVIPPGVSVVVVTMPMACGCTRKSSALAEFSKSLQKKVETNPLGMQYPMYTARLEVVLSMSQVRTHQELLHDGVLQEFDSRLGKAMFVSHQWAAKCHPDPKGEKLKVLQEALSNLSAGKVRASPAVEVEMLYGRLEPYSKAKLNSVQVYVWYDYFCVPQFCLESDSDDVKILCSNAHLDQPKAIASIPAYIFASESRYEFFVALCPTMRHVDTAAELNRYTWQRRGWCLSEKMTRELASREGLILLIESPMQLSLLQAFRAEGLKEEREYLAIFSPAWDSLYYSPGDGDFTVEADRAVVVQIMKDMLQHTLHKDLSQGDLQNYRFYLQQQPVRFRNCATTPLEGLLPSQKTFDLVVPLRTDDLVADFLHRTGFVQVRERDADGWPPLCYAALGESPELIEALLARHADPNTTVSKSIRRLYHPKRVPVVSICAAFGNNGALQVLLHARADPNQREGRGNPPLFYSSLADNLEGARLLLQARADPCAESDLSISVLEFACNAGASRVAKEIFATPAAGRAQFLLHTALVINGGNPAHIAMMIEAGCEVNEQFYPKKLGYRLLYMIGTFAAELGPSTYSALSYHHTGATPLMLSILAGYFSAAQVVISLQHAEAREGAQLPPCMGAKRKLKDVFW